MMMRVLRIYNKKTREVFAPSFLELNDEDYDFRIISTEKHVLYISKGGIINERVSEEHRERQVANCP